MKTSNHGRNIGECSQDMATRRMANAAPSSDGKTRTAPTSPITKDRLDVSAVARLIADSARELAAVHRLRPEKVQEFKNELNGHASITDDTIDAIFKRMISS